MWQVLSDNFFMGILFVIYSTDENTFLCIFKLCTTEKFEDCRVESFLAIDFWHFPVCIPLSLFNKIQDGDTLVQMKQTFQSFFCQYGLLHAFYLTGKNPPSELKKLVRTWQWNRLKSTAKTPKSGLSKLSFSDFGLTWCHHCKTFLAKLLMPRSIMKIFWRFWFQQMVQICKWKLS